MRYRLPTWSSGLVKDDPFLQKPLCHWLARPWHTLTEPVIHYAGQLTQPEKDEKLPSPENSSEDSTALSSESEIDFSELESFITNTLCIENPRAKKKKRRSKGASYALLQPEIPNKDIAFITEKLMAAYVSACLTDLLERLPNVVRTREVAVAEATRAALIRMGCETEDTNPPPRFAKHLFKVYAPIQCSTWAVEGMCGGIEIALCVTAILSVAASPWILIPTAIVFGIITLGMVLAIDLPFVAEGMGINYLNDNDQINRLQKQTADLETIYREIEQAQQDGARFYPEIEDYLRAAQTLEKQIQASWNELQTSAEKSKRTRKGLKRAAIAASFLLVTGSATMVALNITTSVVVTACLVSSPIGWAVIAATVLFILLQWISFYFFERNRINTAVDATCGLPPTQLKTISHQIEGSKIMGQDLQKRPALFSKKPLRPEEPHRMHPLAPPLRRIHSFS